MYEHNYLSNACVALMGNYMQILSKELDYLEMEDVNLNKYDKNTSYKLIWTNEMKIIP